MPSDLIDADAAAALLGVKRATLYVYVSRGLVTSHRRAGSREAAYNRVELLRLKARRASPAAGALSYGDPVLDTSITRIDVERGPIYRGHAAIDLAKRGVTFEAAAHLLWTGRLPGEARPPFLQLAKKLPALDKGQTLLDGIERAVATLRRSWPDFVERDVELKLAPVLVGSLLRWLIENARVRDASALDPALVLIADHELNPSTFAARVTASTGAPLATCIHAGLLALSGPTHGGACDRIEALLDEIRTPGRAFDVVRARLKRGDEVPGFFATLYPDGDPRTAPLLAQLKPPPVVRALIEAMRDLSGVARGHAHPAVDLALVSVARTLGLPRGAATALFALGRTAGWIAHVAEQRQSALPLRPRARFVGS